MLTTPGAKALKLCTTCVFTPAGSASIPQPGYGFRKPVPKEEEIHPAPWD